MFSRTNCSPLQWCGSLQSTLGCSAVTPVKTRMCQTWLHSASLAHLFWSLYNFLSGGLFLNSYPLSDNWGRGSWGTKVLCVTALDVPALTQSRSLFTETPPDYPNIELTPDSKGTTHKDSGKKHIRRDKPFNMCSEQGECLYRYWQKEVRLVTFHLARFYSTHFSEPTWLKDILLYSGWEGKKTRKCGPFGRRCNRCVHTDKDRKGDRYTNEETKALPWSCRVPRVIGNEPEPH